MSLFRPRISSRRQTASRRLRRAHPACCSATRPARSRFPASVPQEQSARSATYPDADPAARGGSVRPPARRRHAISTGTGSRSRPAVGWESRTPRIGSVRMPRVRRPRAACGCTLPQAGPTACRSAPRSMTVRPASSTCSRSRRIRGAGRACRPAAGRRVRRLQDCRVGFAGWPRLLPSAAPSRFAGDRGAPGRAPARGRDRRVRSGRNRIDIGHVRTPRYGRRDRPQGRGGGKTLLTSNIFSKLFEPSRTAH